MGEKLIIGPINKGLKTDREPFVIDNDSFPTLINAYQWRGRILRKRGTELLNRLQRLLPTESIGTTGSSPWTINTLYSNYTPSFTPEANATIVPGSVQIFLNVSPVTGSIVTPGYTLASDCEVFTTPTGLSTGDQVSISGVVVVPGTGPDLINGGPYTIEVLAASFKIGRDSHSWGTWQSGGTWTKESGAIIFQDQGNGTLTSTTPGNSGTINYLTGVVVLTHTAGAGVTADATFSYYPALPVMGLEDFVEDNTQFPGCIAFDTKYSYNVPTTFPYVPYDVSFYKNPVTTAAYIGYIPKESSTHFTWNGQSYQQFWTTNYNGALWATNGIQIPFNINNIGMQYKLITGIIYTGGSLSAGPPAIAQITIASHGLIQGDFVYINEVGGISGINFQTGYVILVVDANNVNVEFPNATLANSYSPNTGIAQYLTNTSDATKDCIRWYDGDPTLNSGNDGWVNFMPPLSKAAFSIAGLPSAIYYLIGARMIIPFKDRLLFIGPVVQTKAAGSQVYLQDTVIYSQNGTPYYTSSFTDTPSNYGVNPTISYTPILVPINQTATPSSYFADNTGFGGNVTAGVDQPIITVGVNEDALILGFSTIQVRFIFTGSDIIPFNFFTVNAELGSTSTFSAVIMDQGVITRGSRGFIITGQTSSQRIDTEVLPQVFSLSLQNNGNERFCAQRDFINEWIYFTYLTNKDNSSIYIFPNQTLQYNYRDQSWAIFNETYTTYGQFRKQSGDTWLTIKEAWEDWNEPWDDGETTLFQPLVIAGNQQGFIMIRNQGTGEDTSLFISNISGSTITSPDHGLNNDDYIIINGCNGNIGAQVNGKIFSVYGALQNSFLINPGLVAGTYTGGGLITRLYVPFLQSKQFPQEWGLGRKTRIGVQQYLFDKTSNGQVQLLLYLSQNGTNAFNNNNFVPINDTIYSTTVYTCPESTNLGLTPANTNLNLPTASLQNQIWHRLNTSLIGDTVQFGITLSDPLMREFNPTSVTYVITGATQAYPCVLTAITALGVGAMIQITGVQGMTQLNNSLSLYNAVYQVISVTGTTVTINVDSSAFSSYTSGGIITVMDMPNQQTEIAFHAAILDLTPSSLLV